MPTYPIPQSNWNSIVTKTVKRLATSVSSISPNQLVGSVQKDKEYYLWISFRNTSNLELEYEDVEIRLVGKADQLDFINPPGAIDYNGNPRVHLHTGRLDPGQERGFRIRFRARKSMATKSIKFSTGIYGLLVPRGHYWTNLSPTV